MGELRGKYRQYDAVKKYNKRAGASKQSEKGSTYEQLLAAGINMADRVAAERCRHYIGKELILNRKFDKDLRGLTVGGVIVGLYPHFILLDCGNYKATITYTDLVLGGKVYTE